MKLCPDCGLPAISVIYYGLPHGLCAAPSAPHLFGFWSELTRWLPFNGEFWYYEPGGYWRSLWEWLWRVDL